MNRPSALLRFWLSCIKSNAHITLEYRTSLISQALGMFVANVMWLVFFSAYYDRFHLPGWGRAEVITLWSVTAGAFGFAVTLFGNSPRLAGLIVRGELDFYLPLPKPVLLHVLASRMGLVSLGDLAFAFLAFAWIKPSPLQWGLFLLCTVSGAVVCVSFAVIAGSLAFWLGSAETAAGQLYMALISFSTYPNQIFTGVARLLLFTVIPAAFIAGVPVELIRTRNVWLVFAELGAAGTFLIVARSVFHAGLKRYTSGNLISARE